MEANLEAAGDAATGAVVAKALSPGPGSGPSVSATACRNCKASVQGKYCAVCGQVANPHRSLISLGHDILHGVFHVEGRIWHTLPELFFKPGRLTRRYIDGERAKFIAPLPLFLFSVFFMFAVFSFVPGGALDYSEKTIDAKVSDWKRGNSTAIDNSSKLIDGLRTRLTAPDVTPEQRAELETKIAELERARGVMQSLAAADWEQLGVQAGASADGAAKGAEAEKNEERAARKGLNFNVGEGVPDEQGFFWDAIRRAQENPGLLLYKFKTNIYKFSWALIPLSLPFMWLLYCWRRDIHLYDHAVFVTYSLSFMTLLLVLLSLAGAMGLSSGLRSAIFGVVAPLHLYKQMRDAYASSALGTVTRLVVLSIFIGIIATVFFVMLLLLGVFS